MSGYLRPPRWRRSEWWIFGCVRDDCGGGVAVPPCPDMNGSTPRCPQCGGALYVVRCPEPPRAQRVTPALIFSRPTPAPRDLTPAARRVEENNRRRVHRRARAAMERARTNRIASEVALSARHEHFRGQGAPRTAA